ncbi:hypothetical protein [Falsiroseomonas sp. E2-1-a20]|uniref:hypothetical protein n=1 Tax=Falsiroseomonas sp. E2-1-a20 TaxID=3239300 RepID=UPI003F403E66
MMTDDGAARRQRRRRVPLIVARGRAYVPSDMRAAVRRASQCLAAEAAAGRAPPLADWVRDLRRSGRAAGYASRRRLVIVRFDVDPASMEDIMVSTGARTVAEAHTLEAYLHAYIDGAGLGDDPKGPLFRTLGRGTKRLTCRSFDLTGRLV